jgi:mercury(II) reductase
MPKTNGYYDLAVIGAGSAGFSAAITAAEQGAKVALIGHSTIGGTCVNVGCVPSKTMIRAAETLHQAKTASRFHGVEASGTVTDWSAVMADKSRLVAELRQAKYTDILLSYESITYREGKARLADGGVSVNGDLLKAGKVIIATGSSASLPPIEGINDVPYLTSTTALELDHLPASMIVIGGGVIGCELGQMFARMGTTVTILCRSRLLPSAEPEISEALQESLETEGIGVLCGAIYKSITTDGDVCLGYERDGTHHDLIAEKVLVATGRRPNSDDLGLEEMGVELLPNAGIKIDDRMRTTRTDVYAVGDVTGRDMFVYMAANGAKIASENALNGDSRQYDNSAMPEVIFTDPQVAMVGLTEAAAREVGYSVKTSILGLENVPRALAARDTRGLIKLVADANTQKLIGAHIMAPEGADSIQTAAIAIKVGMTTDQLGEMIFPYLTTVEGLKLAAQTFDKDVSKLSCCAG